MRIDSSTIGMESARRYTSSTIRTSRFLVKDYKGEAAHESTGGFSNLLNPETGEELETGTGSEESKKNSTDAATASVEALDELQQRVEAMRANRMGIRSSSQSSLNSFRQYTMRSILAMLLGGEKAESIFGKDLSLSTTGTEIATNEFTTTTMNVLTFQKEQYYEESETTSFSTTGVVHTADGREISINLDIAMTRSFSQYFSEEMQIMSINTCDPLVLNFDGNAAELTDQKFLFDIDADGTKDSISGLGAGSGYLALDKNEDGTINDGSELFGPKTGNGFGDLSAYDEDKNGWIDENDDIWSKLKIWCKNEDGTDTLYTLAEKGVGAIGLQKADTDFSLKGANNQTNGIIRSTGIFLYENGNVGTVQHLDVAN